MHFSPHPWSLLLSLSFCLTCDSSLCLSPPLSSVSPPQSIFILLPHSLRLSQGPEVRIDRGEILTDWNAADEFSPSSSSSFSFSVSSSFFLGNFSFFSSSSLPSPSLQLVHLLLFLILPLHAVGLRYIHTSPAEDLSLMHACDVGDTHTLVSTF